MNHFLLPNSIQKMSKENQKLDFDEEAKKLWARLNLDPNSLNRGLWNHVDPIYKHPTGNGQIFVGNQTAAENLSFLKSLNITHIVNCTYGHSKIPNFHEKHLKYYTFAISNWQSFVNSTNASILAFIDPLFRFIDDAIEKGENVLVHCLAGAHRAGTTGCACLMHYANLDVPTAISTAKSLRPIIDPIGQLPEFLHRFKRAQDYRKQQTQQQTISSTSSSSSSSIPPSSQAKEVEGQDKNDIRKIFIDNLGKKF